MKQKRITFNVFSGIGLILIAWTVINWLSLYATSRSAAIDYPVSFLPFVALDSLFPNPDNDRDGPFVLGLMLLPLVALIVGALGVYYDKIKTVTGGKSGMVFQVVLFVAVLTFVTAFILPN